MAPANVHTLSGRSTTLGPPVIVGIVAGGIAFALILLLAWWFIWRRWREAEAEKRRPRSVRRLSLESKSSFDLPPGVSKIMPDPPVPSPTGSSQYFHVLSSLQQSPLLRDVESSSPPFPSPTGTRGPSKVIWKVPSVNQTEDRMSPPPSRRMSTMSPLMRFKSSVSALSRSSSVTSSSVYSAASAPLSDHDVMLRHSTLDPVPSSAPPWMTSVSKPDGVSGSSAVANRTNGIRPLPRILIPGKSMPPVNRHLSAQVRRLPPIPDTASSSGHGHSLSLELDIPVMAPTSVHNHNEGGLPVLSNRRTIYMEAPEMSFAAASTSLMTLSFAPPSSSPSPAPSDLTESAVTPSWPLPPIGPLVIVPRNSAVPLIREEMTASPPQVCLTFQTQSGVPAPQVPARSPMRGVNGA